MDADSGLAYTPAKGLKSSNRLGYTIGDGRLSASATVSVRLQNLESDSKGNGKNR
ncbi:hypothetical protein [Zobellella sp. DQSA1]|uniref:hypothetical protein n=1 Tax=Zobellella sp. DQSA1 TaxID=3342386 RepID=UPI0035BF12A5